MADWPLSLPQNPLQDGFSEDLPRLTVATEMDAGPAKIRRRFTAGVTKYQFEFVMTLAQLNTFKTFYETTTQGGSVKFGFPDPYTTTLTDFRFDTENVPQVKSDNGYYRVSVQMEKLP